MRLLWYAGTSSALAAGVVAYAFNQRANFYSAMVYLSQNNLSLMILINLILLVYGSFVWGLQRLCYGPLRPVEIEQLYEKAWFAVTETCLAMTIFREEVGAWFLVMFTALVTGKVWEWIGEGRVEVLEQQPPVNPRLFHTRLSVSLLLSVVYDSWLFMYTVNAVIQQARPNMMVMFLFEFAILTTCSFRTSFRYLLSLVEADIVKRQTQQRLEERRKQVRDQRADIMRRRESGDAAEAEAAEQEELPSEEDIDETDIEVPGWGSKGQWVLSLDLMTDFVKLGIYSAFFAILMMFYGLPIHIMRDLFMTARSFVKRLKALIMYRKAVQSMMRYPDATEEELAREDTCIICREEMRPWDPNATGAIERTRPKRLPCGHILHFGCLKSWIERQQACPTCRRPVPIDGAAPNGAGAAAPGANSGGQANAPGEPAPGNRPANGAQPAQARGAGNMRIFQFGPIRLGFAQGNAQNIHEMAQRLRLPLDGANVPAVPAPPAQAPPTGPTHLNNNLGSILEMQTQLQEISQRLQQEMQALQASQAELQTLYALTAELNRLRQVQQDPQTALPTQPGQPGITTQFTPYQPAMPQQPLPPFQPMTHIPHFSAFPPRVSTPTIARHGGVSYSASIPAGSPNLPEGVVIPPGWSLLPLERLDGQPQQVPLNTQQPVQQVDINSQQSQPVDTATSTTTTSGLAGIPQPSSRTGDSNARNFGVPSGYSEERPAQTIPQVQREPPAVAAPTPVMPNWGGAAQLFSHNGVGGSTSANESETRPEEAPKSEASQNQSSDDEQEASSSSAKGKAKAVTVEDAEDE